MADLLRWSAGMSLPRKKEEETTPLITSLRTMNPTFNRGNSSSNQLQISDQFSQRLQQSRLNEAQRQQKWAEDKQRQEQQNKIQQVQQRQAEQARQEEAQRQQRFAEAQRQAEAQRRLQEQQAQQRAAAQAAAIAQQKQAQQKAQQQQKQQTNDEGWKKYYDEEKQKVRDSVFKGKGIFTNEWLEGTLNDMFNAGWDSRLAETNARNRYAGELLRKAYDEEGNVLDQSAANQVKGVANQNSRVAKQYADYEHAKGKAIGATYDSDYKDNRFYATLNAIRGMDVGNAMVGGAEGAGADVLKFALNLLPGMATAPIQGGGNIAEAISGKGLDTQTGEHKELTTSERWGRGLSGAIDAAGVFFGGSKDFLESVGKSLFRKGATEATKQAVKQTSKQVIKGYLKAMLEEGAEEAVQQAFEFFGDGGTLVTEDGEFDAESFKQLLAESAQAGALGAAGGGMFHAGGRGIDAVRNAINVRKGGTNTEINSNLNNNLVGNSNVVENTNVEENTNVGDTNVTDNVAEETNVDPSRVKEAEDGSMVKTNADGTNTRLSDAEFANVLTNSQQSVVTGLNPFESKSLNLKSGSEDINTLARRAEQGDTYAKQRLAELMQEGIKENQNTDWRGKNVGEVINPESENIEINQLDNQNLTNEWLDTETFNQLAPAEQRAYLEQHSNAPALWLSNLNDNQLADVARAFDIDPNGMNAKDMIRAIQEKIRTPNIEVNSQSEVESGQEVLPSERAVDDEIVREVVRNNEDLAQEPVIPTKTDTTGAGEGTTEASIRIPTTEELSTVTPEQARKNAQFAMLQETNPMTDSYHTGIRSASEINTLNDLVNNYDANNMFTYPDFTIEDVKRAVKNGMLPVYSSKPIEPGAFISPSKMMATDYAGGDQNSVYSREIPINDFAAIESGDEGNYLPINQSTDLSNKIDEVLNNKNYRQPILLRDSTPDVLVELGIKDLPMYENPSHIRNNILTETEAKNAGVFRNGDNYHGLGKDVYMDAINALDVPRAVFKKNNGSNDFLVLTAVKDSNGNTVIVPIEIETSTVANYMKIDTNRVKSVFGYDSDFGRTLDKYIKDNLKSDTFTKIELGKRLTDIASSNGSVSQNGSNVNANNPVYQYYQKYGEDFYEKMPDNLKEKYEEMLDMQPRDGSGRYIDPITGDQIIDQEANGFRNYEAESENLPEDFDVKHYVSDQVEAQQKRSKVPLKERIADATAELKHYLVDDAVAYERYIKDKNERLNIREGVDRVRSSDMIARQYMKDHGLDIIGKMSDSDLNEFQQYLIAKRALEVAEQGKATGRSKAADQALIDSVGNKYAEQEAVIRQYTRDMLEYSADNGLISQKLKNKLIAENPNYVPMNRVFDVVEKKTGFKSKQLGNLSDQSVVKKMTGSERVVDNPIESLMSNTMRMINEAERNKTAQLIAQSEAFHEKVLKDGEKPRAGYDKLSYMIDGETVSYEVPKLVAQEMKNLNSVMPQAAEKALKILGAPTRWLRSGATQNNPIFALSNLMRDQMQTFVTGKVSANLKGTKDAIVATFSPGKRGKELRAELNRAGIIGSEYRQTYGYKSGDLMAQLQADSNLKKGAVERLKHPVDALGDLIGRTEYFTRAQQYFGTDGDATTKAQAARNNTLNFGRAGATTRILNRIIPFLNAGIQGGRITVNSFKNRPIHTTLTMATLTGMALAARGAAEAQDKELWDRIDDSDKEQNLIIFTPDAHYNSESNRVEGIIKIPVAQMLYPLMDAANNMKGDASDASMLAGDIFTAVTGLEAPNEEQGGLPVVNQLTPTIAKPFVEMWMNKSTYTGNDLVSEYDSNKAPEDKGAKYTSGLARSIASITGVDAPVVDNFIQNWGGGLAKDLSKTLTDNPDNTKDGGGIGAMFENGFNRRFLSGTVESQYEIAEGLAKNYKNEVKNSEAFKNLTSAEQQKVLNDIDSDMKSIASMATKVEQGRNEELEGKSLTARQTEIVNNGFNADSYISAITDKKATYSGNGNGGDVTTLGGNLSDYGKTGKRNNSITANDSLGEDYKAILDKYNSMDSDEWNEYIYGTSAESAAAEYKLAKAKYENDLANGDINEAQKIKRQKELAKLAVSQNWTKEYRDAYSLAGTKADMQAYLNTLDDAERAQTVAVLNGLNNAMYEAGIITASTYKTRANAINNTVSGRSSGSGRKKSSDGITSAEASALSSLAKTLVKNTNSTKASKSSAPTTNRKMANTKSSSNKTGLAKYTPSAKKKVSVTKGAKRSIA